MQNVINVVNLALQLNRCVTTRSLLNLILTSQYPFHSGGHGAVPVRTFGLCQDDRSGSIYDPYFIPLPNSCKKCETGYGSLDNEEVGRAKEREREKEGEGGAERERERQVQTNPHTLRPLPTALCRSDTRAICTSSSHVATPPHLRARTSSISMRAST